VGSRIDVSMLESLVEWMGNPLYYGFEGQEPAQRSGASHPSIYPYGPFLAGDGRTVLFGVQNEREWAIFCQLVLDRPALVNDPRFCSNALRSANRSELRQLIESAFGCLTASAVIERLDIAGIGNASVNTMQDVWAHPQLAARDSWVMVDSPAGPIPAMKPPARSDAFDGCMGAVPALGSHTESILRSLGYGAEAIQALRAQSVV
jgi:itaconate CoA-transferase